MNPPASPQACAEVCAEIRPEYRLFLANLAVSIGREDLVRWCFEYSGDRPSLAPLPLCWHAGTLMFAAATRPIPLIDNSRRPIERDFLVGEDTVAADPNALQPKRPVGYVRTHGQVRYVTFYRDGKRKTVRLGTVAELANEEDAASARR
jgi:hypothetical protein